MHSYGGYQHCYWQKRSWGTGWWKELGCPVDIYGKLPPKDSHHILHPNPQELHPMATQQEGEIHPSLELNPLATQPEGENHPFLEVTALKYRRFYLRRHSEGEPELSYYKRLSCWKLVITKVFSLHWWSFCSAVCPKSSRPNRVHASPWSNASIPADLTAKR